MPLELHIVHRQPETDQVLVVAVPFEEFPLAKPVRKAAKNTPDAQKYLRQSLASDAHEKVTSVAALSKDEGVEIMPLDREVLKEPLPSDSGFSQALQNLLSYPLPTEGETKAVPLRAGPVDLISPLLGDSLSVPDAFFQYRGSLTAPPCTEQVTWLVRKVPLYASRSQIEVLREAIMQANSNVGNARSVMPLMGRQILYTLGVNGEAPSPPSPPPVDFSDGPRERLVEFRGIAAGKQAMGKALEASDASRTIMQAIGAAQAQAHGVGGAQQDMTLKSKHITMPLPTPDPAKVLSRIADAVATQLNRDQNQQP